MNDASLPFPVAPAGSAASASGASAAPDSDTPESILRQAIAWKEGGAGVALATIVQAWPTAPWRAGSQMAVRDDGICAGSVFGAMVYAEVAQDALAVLATGHARTLRLSIDDETATREGLACGGPMEIRIEPVNDGPGSVVLCSGLRDGRRQLVQMGTAAAAEDPWTAEARRRARADDSGIALLDGAQVLFQVFNAPLRLYVVGAVRAARALLDAARLVGFAVSIVDPRAERMASIEFPGSATVVEGAAPALEAVRLDDRCAVVFLSHAPEIDDPGLQVALASPAFYVGALGSRRTHAARLARLGEAGLAPESTARIHGPAGLAIGALGPAEIAASIVAEIIAVLRQGPASQAAR